jgi:hypothetical protein
MASAHRRGLCWTCYRKLREANLPLPLRMSDRESDPVAAWVTALPPPAVDRLLTALGQRRAALRAIAMANRPPRKPRGENSPAPA